MTDKEIIDLKLLTNSYASSKMKNILDELEKAFSGSANNIVYTRDRADKVIGKFIALAYAQGFADHADKVEPKRNIFM